MYQWLIAFLTGRTPPGIRSFLAPFLPDVSAVAEVPCTVGTAPCPLGGQMLSGARGPILMLDFDGVLHPRQTGTFAHVGLLADWLRAHPSVDVVISSSWRETTSLGAMRDLFPYDLQHRIVGTTPIFEGRMREEEVLSFARLHAVRQWVALDDAVSEFPTTALAHLVATDYGGGLSPSDLDRLCRLLACPRCCSLSRGHDIEGAKNHAKGTNQEQKPLFSQVLLSASVSPGLSNAA